MSNQIILKKSSVGAKVPATTDLAYGELALNYADGKLYFKNSSNVISSFASLGSNNTWTGSNQFNGTLTIDTLRYKNSNIQKFSQVYNGGASGQSTGYLDTGEFQPYLTVTPTGNSDNYSVVGKIIVQSGNAFQAINIRAALRSNTLPSLSWACTYDQEINSTGGTELVTPVLWVNQTGTGTPQFILALNANATIYGTVTVDIECSSRYQGTTYYNAEVFNTVNPSEITSLPANFTSYTFTKNYTADSGTVNYASSLSVNSIAVPTISSYSTLTNKTLNAPTITGGGYWAGSSSGQTLIQATAVASGTLTLPAATDTLVGRATTDTLTNKTLTSPTINNGTAAGSLTVSGTLKDKNNSAGLSGQYLVSTNTGVQWVTLNTGALSNLTDVNLSAPKTQQVLTYNGTQWVNADSNAVVASAVFASSQYDMGQVTDGVVTVSEDEGTVIATTNNIYDLGVLSFTGIISLNNIDQSVKSDYLGYSIIFGF
jgi:hypothetical protein